MFESLSDETMLIAVDIIIIMTISALLGYTAYRILRNPFRYPYFVYTFDVSYKRNVDITDYVDGFLCDERNWDMLIVISETSSIGRRRPRITWHPAF